MQRMVSIAAVFVLALSLHARAAGFTELPALTHLTNTVAAQAAHGQWDAARKSALALKKEWTAMRPSIATTRLQTAHAETIDASIAWMLSAIDQKRSDGTRDACMLVVRTIDHLIEDHRQNR